MSAGQLANAKAPLYEIPIALGGTVLIYSQKVPKDLRFSGTVLAKIYLGQIKSWNDPGLAAINPRAALPNLPITVAYRSDANAATATYTKYLSDSSPSWKDQIGNGVAVKWPTGGGRKGDEGHRRSSP